MRLPSVSDACASLAMLALSSPAAAQFIYPPPLKRPLSDYTSGKVQSALNFSDGDNMLGAWSTPGNLMSFLLYRCVHTPTSEPTFPSNSSFTSRDGQVADDGTWEQMPLYEGFDNGFGNGFNPGKTPIWFHGPFEAPTKESGNLCWFELYPGRDTISYENGPERIAEVNGGGEWYFASVPFTVKPKRPSGVTVLWKDDGTERGGPQRNSMFKNASDVESIRREFGIEPRPRRPDNDSGASNLTLQGTFLSVVVLSLAWYSLLAI
jgi:hypothetical protein